MTPQSPTPAPPTSAPPFEVGRRAEIVGLCVGRRRMGSKLLFLDLVPTDTPSRPLTSGPAPVAEGPPGARDYAPRARSLRIRELVNGPGLFTVIVTRNEGFMGAATFRALCAALGDPEGITKPRIGDVFAVEGVWESRCVLRGRPVARLRADACTLLARGEISRPGDYADKTWHLPKGRQNARSRRAQRKKAAHRAAHGFEPKSRRARVFADWLVATFGERLRCVDVAGGAGALSRTLGGMGCESVVIDPRGTAEDVSRVDQLFDLAIPEVRAACADADVLLGMHPDGAVNAIVAAACALECGFAIVPCCVFPTAYPRHLDDGTEVTERDQLVAWIFEECRRRGWRGELTRFELPLEGARVGVFGRPSAGDL